jgi:hypothetical protein
MNYTEVILKYYPNMKFGADETYESIEWYETEYEKPTEEELNAKWEEMKDEYELNLFRIERNALLKESDLYVISDYPHNTPEIKEAWITYRQALRDSTKDKILPSPPS